MFAEAMKIMEQKELSDFKKSIRNASEENGVSVLDLAAAFMQMHMGDEPEEIREERPYFDKNRRNKERQNERKKHLSSGFRRATIKRNKDKR